MPPTAAVPPTQSAPLQPRHQVPRPALGRTPTPERPQLRTFPNPTASAPHPSAPMEKSRTLPRPRNDTPPRSGSHHAQRPGARTDTGLVPDMDANDSAFPSSVRSRALLPFQFFAVSSSTISRISSLGDFW